MRQERAGLDPYISVIVTAHDRRQYLPEALHSLEAQSLDRSKFEVIVVKNFEDPESDVIIKRNGWKEIVVPGQTDVIQKIVVGLEEAKGDVITFLEDDDLYVPERLAYIHLAFKKIKDLTWFHNLQHYIDRDGNPIPLSDPRVKVHIVSQPSFSVLLRSNDRAWLRIAARYTGIDFNASSTAVRRDLVEGLRSLKSSSAEGLSSAPDTVVTLLAALSDGLLLHTSRRLTYCRIYARSEGERAVKRSLARLTYLSFLKERGHLCASARDLRRRPLCLLLYSRLWGSGLQVTALARALPMAGSLTFLGYYVTYNDGALTQLAKFLGKNWPARRPSIKL